MTVIKVKTTPIYDIFSYRDMYNEEQLVKFPVFWGMTEKEVEKYLEL